MVIIFVVVFLFSLLLIARPVLNRTRVLVFLLLFYFMAVREPVNQFFEIHYQTVVLKFMIYVFLIAVPVLILIVLGMRHGWRIGIAVIVSFVLMLPFTRPTLPCLRMMADWKIRFLQDRFFENLWRVNPTAQDISILESSCHSLSPHARNRFVAYLRNFAIPESSNECLTLARNWRGPKPGPELIVRHTEEEWGALFQSGNNRQRAGILDQLRRQRNPALKSQAVANVSSLDETLVISAVQYLRQISGIQIGNDPDRWKEWLSQTTGQAVSSMFSGKGSSPLAQQGFSAIQVQDDLLLARNSREDFLKVYLRNHFPESVSEEQIALLKQFCDEASRRPDSLAVFYRRGMLYFFLALSGTSRIREGKSEDITGVSENWKIALQSLQYAGMPGQELAQEVNQIFRKADQDRDGDLSKQEVLSILQKHGH